MNKRSWIVFFIVFTNLVGAGVVVPTLPLYAEGRFSATAFEIAIFMALYHMAQFVSAPILGQLSDRVGRRPVLFWSQIGTVASFLLFIYAAPISDMFGGVLGAGLLLLYVARIIDGVTGGNITAAQAYITDITDEKDRAEALGYIQMAFGLGLIFGPAFGGVLAKWGLSAPFIGAAVITSISATMTFFFLKESLPQEKRLKSLRKTTFIYKSWGQFFSNQTILLLLALSFAVVFTMSGLSAMFPLYADRVLYPDVADSKLVAQNVGYMITGIGLMAVFSQVLLLKPLIKKYGEINVILFGLIAASITTFALSWYTNPIIIAVALLPGAFSYAVGIPAGQAILVNMADDNTRGQLIGLYQAVNSGAYICGPIIAGYLFEVYSPQTPFILSGLLVMGALMLGFVLKSRSEQVWTL